MEFDKFFRKRRVIPSISSQNHGEIRNTYNLSDYINKTSIEKSSSNNQQLPPITKESKSLPDIDENIKLKSSINHDLDCNVSINKEIPNFDNQPEKKSEEIYKKNSNFELNEKVIKLNQESEFDFLDEIRKKELFVEDEHLTEIHFNTLYQIEFCTMFFTINSIGSGVLNHHFRNYGKLNCYDLYSLEIAKSFSIIMLTISNVLFIIVTVLRYVTIIQLKKSNKEILSYESILTNQLKDFTIELVLCIVNPVIFLENITFNSTHEWNLIDISYEVNDFLCIVLLLRIYTIFRFMISCSIYYNIRANRVVKLFGNKLTRLFSIRCLVISDPYLYLLIISIVLIFSFSYMIRIIEGPVNLIYNQDDNLSIIQNCIWYVTVTMTTLGFGDYYSKTNIGRILSILCGLTGMILVSFIVVAFTNSLKFTENELRAFDQREKQGLRQMINRKVADLFISIHKYHLLKKNYTNAINRGGSSKNQIENLKKQVKEALYLRIKNKRKFKNILHKFRTLYDPMTEFDSINQKIDMINSTTISAMQKIEYNSKYIEEINFYINNIRKLKKRDKSYLESDEYSIDSEETKSFNSSIGKPTKKGFGKSKRRLGIFNKNLSRKYNLALFGGGSSIKENK